MLSCTSFQCSRSVGHFGQIYSTSLYRLGRSSSSPSVWSSASAPWTRNINNPILAAMIPALPGLLLQCDPSDVTTLIQTQTGPSTVNHQASLQWKIQLWLKVCCISYKEMKETYDHNCMYKGSLAMAKSTRKPSMANALKQPNILSLISLISDFIIASMTGT